MSWGGIFETLSAEYGWTVSQIMNEITIAQIVLYILKAQERQIQSLSLWSALWGVSAPSSASVKEIPVTDENLDFLLPGIGRG